jgi:hypothetical protein
VKVKAEADNRAGSAPAKMEGFMGNTGDGSYMPVIARAAVDQAHDSESESGDSMFEIDGMDKKAYKKECWARLRGCPCCRLCDDRPNFDNWPWYHKDDQRQRTIPDPTFLACIMCNELTEAEGLLTVEQKVEQREAAKDPKAWNTDWKKQKLHKLGEIRRTWSPQAVFMKTASGVTVERKEGFWDKDSLEKACGDVSIKDLNRSGRHKQYTATKGPANKPVTGYAFPRENKPPLNLSFWGKAWTELNERTLGFEDNHKKNAGIPALNALNKSRKKAPPINSWPEVLETARQIKDGKLDEIMAKEEEDRLAEKKKMAEELEMAKEEIGGDLSDHKEALDGGDILSSGDDKRPEYAGPVEKSGGRFGLGFRSDRNGGGRASQKRSSSAPQMGDPKKLRGGEEADLLDLDLHTAFVFLRPIE